jgi:hypothetical protein
VRDCRSAEVYFVPVKADQARASCWSARLGGLLEVISVSCSGLRTPRLPALGYERPRTNRYHFWTPHLRLSSTSSSRGDSDSEKGRPDCPGRAYSGRALHVYRVVADSLVERQRKTVDSCLQAASRPETQRFASKRPARRSGVGLANPTCPRPAAGGGGPSCQPGSIMARAPTHSAYSPALWLPLPCGPIRVGRLPRHPQPRLSRARSTCPGSRQRRLVFTATFRHIRRRIRALETPQAQREPVESSQEP